MEAEFEPVHRSRTLKKSISKAKPCSRLKITKARTTLSFRFLTQLQSPLSNVHSTKSSHQKQLAKIQSSTPLSSYETSPFRPGFHFYSVFTHLKSHKLHIHFPSTLLVLSSSSHYLYTNKKGFLASSQNFSRAFLHEKLKQTNGPVAGLRKSAGEEGFSTHTQPLSLHEFRDEIMKGVLSTSRIFQQFIKSYGERPSVTRIFYVNDTRHKLASRGYIIQNKPNIHNTNSRTKAVVCTEYEFEVYTLGAKALQILEQYSKNLVDFLQTAFAVKIEEIVLDFVKDSHRKYWFIGCQGFRLDQKVLRTREIRLKHEKNKSKAEIKQEIQETREDRLGSTQCKLCLLTLKPFEVDTLLPFKLLLLYKRRAKLSGRKRFKLSHLREKGPNYLSYWVRVCHLCHILLKEEYELFQLETRLAQFLHIPLQHLDLSEKPKYSHPAFLPLKTRQWRLLLYIEQATVACPLTNLSIRYTFLGNSYQDQVLVKNTKGHSAELCYTKQFYVFAETEQAMAEFCTNERLVLRLFAGSSRIGKASAFPLKDFSCEFGNLTQEFYLAFTGQVNSLKLHSGISKDSEFNPRKLPLDIQKYKNVFVPAKSHFTSDTLPASWLELFDDEYQVDKGSQYEDSSEELQGMYLPHLTPSAVFVNPLGSKKVLHLNYSLNPLEARPRTTTSNNKKQEDLIYAQFRAGSERLHQFIPVTHSLSLKKLKQEEHQQVKGTEADLINSIAKYLVKKKGQLE